MFCPQCQLVVIADELQCETLQLSYVLKQNNDKIKNEELPSIIQFDLQRRQQNYYSW